MSNVESLLKGLPQIQQKINQVVGGFLIGAIISCVVVGGKVGVTPVWILISVLMGGSYFGGMGMILAIPVAALINVYINRLYEMKMDKVQSKGKLNSFLKKDTI